MRAESEPVARPLDHLILAGAEAAPALVLREGVVSYKELRSRIARLAGWLRHRVPDHGARVASWVAKGELACLMPLAAARAGLVHVPVNPLLKRAQVAHILGDSGASLLIGTQARLDSLEPGDVPQGCAIAVEGEALAEAEALGAQLAPSHADTAELAAILYTSGSTGRPKGVMLSHANMWLGAVSVASYLGIEPSDRVLAVLPLSFDYGQNQLLSTWHAGGCVVPLDYLTPRDVMKAVGKHGITTLAAVPPLWVQLAELDWTDDARTALKRLTNSGGALTPDLVTRLRALFPAARLFAMYGLTEAFRSTYLDPALIDSHPTSMGKAIPYAEILVVDDKGGITADGEEGELVHCGPLVAQGYWRDAKRTAERFRPAPAASRYGGTAVWSGDRVRRERGGLLYFAGRRDAMIKSAGNRISPQEIEEAALATGLVAEAVALGVPDARLGQAVHLVVRAAPGSLGAMEELPRKLLQDLPNFMQPRQIHWREAMPIGPNGKIDRTGLQLESDRMKPLGPIPPCFGSRDGELAIDGHTASELVKQAGDTPLFVYSAATIRAKVAGLRKAMPERLALHYAIKANSYRPILQLISELVDGFDVASGGELGMAREAGLAAERISFAGPGKRDRELAAAIFAGATINVESESEVTRALAIAGRSAMRARLAIRVNPDFDLKGSGMKMGGGAKPFGVDAERVPDLARRIIASAAEWRGFHIFAGSQALDAEAIAETQAQTLDLAARLALESGAELPHCNLGGGFGIPYFPGDEPVDIALIGARLRERFANLPPQLADTRFCIELGRYLVGESGVYLTRIIDRKVSHGEIFLVTDGGLHHQLAASGNFGTVVRRNYPAAIASRFDAPVEEEASIVGCLCTPLDILANKAGFPRAEAGDLAAIFCAGAYGASASPAAFLGQGPAREILV